MSQGLRIKKQLRLFEDDEKYEGLIPNEFD